MKYYQGYYKGYYKGEYEVLPGLITTRDTIRGSIRQVTTKGNGKDEQGILQGLP